MTGENGGNGNHPPDLLGFAKATLGSNDAPIGPGAQTFDPRIPKRSIQGFVAADGLNPGDYFSQNFVLQMATAADEIAPWGSSMVLRDRQLRLFWPKESWLASTIYAMSSRNAAFRWKVDGPKSTVQAAQELLKNANFGRGWAHFISQLSIDFYTQDNGCFIEMIREYDSPKSAVIGIAHLDSGRCQRTADPEYPVIFTDRKGVRHKLGWWQVIPIAEMPSAIQTLNGIGFCAVSRSLRASQIIRDISIYQNEKVSGRFNRAIHFVSGPTTSQIADALTKQGARADEAGLIRYTQPLLIASVDPTRPVTVATVALASLPDGFDMEQTLKWYVANLALAFGADFQDLAPLPGGNLGTASQSETLARKSSGKGPALFQSIISHAINAEGILPRNVLFSFEEDDFQEQLQLATIRKLRADARSVSIHSGEIDAKTARDLAVLAGDMLDTQRDALDAQETANAAATTDPNATLPTGPAPAETPAPRDITASTSAPAPMPGGHASTPMTTGPRKRGNNAANP